MNVLGGVLIDRTPQRGVTIGQLADYAGVTIKAVRHYHKRGLLEEPERDVPSVLEASRSAAIIAALRVDAALGAAYQDRWAPPRIVLAACYAVARLIEGLQRPPAAELPRWN